MSLVAGTDWLGVQFRLFLAALGGGAWLALLWQLYVGLSRRFLRARNLRRPTARVWLLPDAAFAVVASALLLAYWFCFTDGGLRSADFLWLLLGFLLTRPLWRRGWLRLTRQQSPPSQRQSPSQQQQPQQQPQQKQPPRTRYQSRPGRLLQASASLWQRLIPPKAPQEGEDRADE